MLTDGSSALHATVIEHRPERAVVVDLSPFGRSGPYAEWVSSDLVTWAMGGYLYFTGAPDREPIWLPGPQAELHAGAHAALGRARRHLRAARAAAPASTWRSATSRPRSPPTPGW